MLQYLFSSALLYIHLFNVLVLPVSPTFHPFNNQSLLHLFVEKPFVNIFPAIPFPKPCLCPFVRLVCRSALLAFLLFFISSSYLPPSFLLTTANSTKSTTPLSAPPRHHAQLLDFWMKSWEVGLARAPRKKKK